MFGHSCTIIHSNRRCRRLPAHILYKPPPNLTGYYYYISVWTAKGTLLMISYVFYPTSNRINLHIAPIPKDNWISTDNITLILPIPVCYSTKTTRKWQFFDNFPMSLSCATFSMCFYVFGKNVIFWKLSVEWNVSNMGSLVLLFMWISHVCTKNRTVKSQNVRVCHNRCLSAVNVMLWCYFSTSPQGDSLSDKGWCCVWEATASYKILDMIIIYYLLRKHVSHYYRYFLRMYMYNLKKVFIQNNNDTLCSPFEYKFFAIVQNPILYTVCVRMCGCDVCVVDVSVHKGWKCRWHSINLIKLRCLHSYTFHILLMAIKCSFHNTHSRNEMSIWSRYYFKKM